MAVLHRILRDSTSRCLKNYSYYISRPLSSLHAHGQRPADSQPLFTPWLAQALDPQHHGILDLLKKSQSSLRFIPAAELSPNRGVPEGFPQLLEEYGIQRHLEEEPTKLGEHSDPELVEDSRSNDEEERLKIWADSVKKKRRKKMNKHKYKKLRKRLRKKTKK